MSTVVLTGIGVVAPSGVGTEQFWKSTLNGENHLAPITRFDASGYRTTLAGEVRDFDPEQYVDRRQLVQTDRWTWLSLTAAGEAIDDAGLDLAGCDPYQLSVVLASTSGGNEFGQRELQRLWTGPGRSVGAYQSIAWFYAASTGQTSIRYGMKGPSSVLAGDTAGGLDTFGHARRTVRRRGGVVLAGGTEAPIGPYALACQSATGLLSSATDPAQAYRPFDRAASGWVPGEGGAVITVEELDEARVRGAEVYAEIAGYAATFDAAAPNRPTPDGRQLQRAIELALRDAGLVPADVDVVFADAAGVPELDRSEATALRAVFGTGTGAPLVTAPKSLIGRLYSGGSALDVATAALAIRDGWVPVVGNLEQPAEGCELAFVTGESQSADIRVTLVVARGHGGFNSALVLRRVDGARA
jgi:minimal PKS chain-length factor (CLF/KS beta)